MGSAKVDKNARQSAADMAAAAREKLSEAGLDRAAEMAAAAREKLASSGLDAKAIEFASTAPARMAEIAAVAPLKAVELAAAAREKLTDAGLDAKATELTARVLESAAALAAQQRARRVTEQSLERIAEWLESSGAATKMGLTSKRRSRWQLVAGMLGGAVAGFAAGQLLSRPRGRQLGEELTTSAERLAEQAREKVVAPGRSLADEIRTRLAQDPRTSNLPRVNINVVEGTVFVRGAVPMDVDEHLLREVIAAIPGVSDVDVQLSTATG